MLALGFNFSIAVGVGLIAVAGLAALLDATTDRGVLKDLDHRIARKIAQAATRSAGVRGFRTLSPSTLYQQFGLTSLVRSRNLR